MTELWKPPSSEERAAPNVCSVCAAELRPIGSTGVVYCPHCDTLCGSSACAPCLTQNALTSAGIAELEQHPKPTLEEKRS